MFCQVCHKPPSFMCCSNLYFCEDHISQHCEIAGIHRAQHLENTALKTELNQRISQLKQAKLDIIAGTELIMKTISNYEDSLIKKINMTIKDYQNLCSSEFLSGSDIFKLQEIMTTDMAINNFSTDLILDDVKSLFLKEFIVSVKKTSEEKLSNSNKFLQSHNGGFLCIVISKDAKVCVTGSEDSTVRFWDLAKKEQVACCVEHKSNVQCLAMSKDSSLVLSGSFDTTLILWDAKTKCSKRMFRGHSGAVFTVVFSNDENFIVSGSRNKEIIIWNVSSGICSKKIITEYRVCCGIFTMKNEYISAVNIQLEMWDLTTYNKAISIKAHDSMIWSMTKTKNDEFLITGSQDKQIKIWKLPSISLHGSLKGHSLPVLSVSVTPDDKFIVSGSEDTTVILWNLKSKSKAHEFKIHNEFVYAVTSTNSLIISASRDSKIAISRISSKKFEFFISQTPFQVRSEVVKNNLYAFGSTSKVIIWDLTEKTADKVLEGHSSPVQATCFSSELDFLISASRGSESNLILWDLNNQGLYTELAGHTTSVFCVDISFDDSYAASGDSEGLVLLWNIKIQQIEAQFRGHTGKVYSVKISKNNEFMISAGSDKNVIVWIIETREAYQVLSGHQEIIWKVVITDNDRYAASAACFEGVKVWSIKKGKEINNFRYFSEAVKWLDRNKDLTADLNKYLV